MKKITTTLVVVLATILPNFVSAEITKPNFNLIYRSNIINPENRDSSTCNETNLVTSWEKNSIGLETDWDGIGYWGIKINGSQNLAGPVWGKIGVSSNNSNLQFIYGGLWIFKKVESLSIYISADYYSPANSEAKGLGYVDPFLSVSYPIWEKLSLGVDIWSDHWTGTRKQQTLIGPFLSYQLTKSTYTLVRVSKDWTRVVQPEKKTTECNSIRAEIGIRF